MTALYAAALLVTIAIAGALWLSEPIEARREKPAPYAGRRRLVEPSLYARLKLRASKRVAWFVLAQTLRYRLTVQIGASA